jgi:HEAT repeat protein
MQTEDAMDLAIRGRIPAAANPPLDEIQRQLTPSHLLDLVHQLRLRAPAERELAARLLTHSVLPGTVVTNEVRHALVDEDDPQVIRWLVAALQHSREPSAVPELKKLAEHADARVRFGVPDALSACARRFSDVADAMIALSRDNDRDVRWSAAFELGASLAGASKGVGDGRLDRVRSRLRELSTSDPDSDIRSTAARALGETTDET